MSQVTHLLDRAWNGDARAAEELLPLVCSELRRLAAHKMALPDDELLALHEALERLTTVDSRAAHAQHSMGDPN
jgi:hypothetical protein